MRMCKYMDAQLSSWLCLENLRTRPANSPRLAGFVRPTALKISSPLIVWWGTTSALFEMPPSGSASAERSSAAALGGIHRSPNDIRPNANAAPQPLGATNVSLGVMFGHGIDAFNTSVVPQDSGPCCCAAVDGESVPLPDSCSATKPILFNHLVGAR